jgi:hypothetical protein
VVTTWAVGVTSCRARVDTLLPRTLDALKRGGFSLPHVFFDGVGVYDLLTGGALNPQNVRMTMRAQSVRVFANWFLAPTAMRSSKTTSSAMQICAPTSKRANFRRSAIGTATRSAATSTSSRTTTSAGTSRRWLITIITTLRCVQCRRAAGR